MLFNQFGSSLSIIQHCFQFLLGRLLVPLRNVFGGTTKSIMVFLKKDLLIKSKSVFILGDPGADSGGEGKSKRAEKYGSKKSKERRLDFPSPLLSAPGSPRMHFCKHSIKSLKSWPSVFNFQSIPNPCRRRQQTVSIRILKTQS